MVAEFSTDRLIVKPSPTASSSVMDKLRAAMGVTEFKQTQLGLEIWKVKQGTVEQVKNVLTGNTSLEYVQMDRIIRLDDFKTTSSTKQNLATNTSQTTTPNDPDYFRLWGLNNTGQTGGTPDADIDAPEAWALATGTQKIPVGVIDSGIDYTHPDLAANMWKNPGEIAGDKIDNDKNGYIDDIYGWDFANNDNNPMDDNEHGTHVAGTIGAVANNLRGVIGVARDVLLVALKFLDASGSGATSNAILAIDYATRNGIRITNNSWGGLVYDQALYDAIEAAGKKGGLFVAAAGNSSTNNDPVPAYPASYDLANIISVASTTHKDELSSFSNYGAESVDIAAPGSDIYSTLPGGEKYGLLSGTSMASPHVAGAAALLLSQNPSLTVQEVKNTLVKTAEPFTYPLLLPFVFDAIFDLKAGRLNVAEALRASTPTDNSNLRQQMQLRMAPTPPGSAGAGNLTETANAADSMKDVADPSAGNTANNTFNGEAGEDFLTGGPSADTLMLPFADSSVSASAPVTYFGSESIDFLTQGGAMMNDPSLSSPAVNSAVATLEKDVMPVFTEANGVLPGNQPLGINSDPFAVANTSLFAEPYLVGLSDAKPLGF